MQSSPAPSARIDARAASATAVVAAMCVACGSGNISGRLAAQGTGDVSAPPVTRMMPEAQPALCRAPAAPGGASKKLARMPYLQRVTSREAVVVWRSQSGASASVLVDTPDGQRPTTFPAVIDTSASAGQWMAVVSGLAADTTYCYTVYQDGEPVTAPAPLTSAPAPGTKEHIQIVAFGDSGGGGDDQLKLRSQIETVSFDLMIHTGDIAYDSGTVVQFESRFFGIYPHLLASRPMFPASGNHEYETADAAPFRQVFVLPDNGGPEGQERWYSYDWGDVHLVALDTERIGAAQANWLEADLNANQLPWTIVYGHRPPHSSGEHGDDSGFGKWFVPILEAHRVPLVLSGHDHDYERFHPIEGTTYIVTGGGGRGVRPLGPLRSSSAYAEAVIHFVVVSVERDALTVHAIDGMGREFDSTVISRARPTTR